MKLTSENVAYIKEAVTLGTLTYKALADKFGVSIGTINKTVREFRGRKESIPSTPAKAKVPGPTLAERSVALQHLEPDDLDGQLRSSLTELNILGRRVSAEIRIRLLPMLREVKRRYDAGETINQAKGYHEYLRSLGLTPSTVRSWAKRNEQKILGDMLKSTGATK